MKLRVLILLFEKSVKYLSYFGVWDTQLYFSKKVEKSKFKTEIKRVVQRIGKNPKKINSSKASETNQTVPKFINMLERPKLKKCKGKAIIFKIGLRKKLISPKIIPKIIKICQKTVILKPRISEPPGIILIPTPEIY